MLACRACDIESNDLCSLFDNNEKCEDLSILFTIVTEIKVSVQDYSIHICLQCAEQLKAAYAFKKKCHIIEAKRKKLYKQIEDISIKEETITSKIEIADSNVVINIEGDDDTLKLEDDTLVSNNLCTESFEVASEDSSDSLKYPNNDEGIFNKNLECETAQDLQEMLYNEDLNTKHKEYACLICEDVFTDSNLLRIHISDLHCESPEKDNKSKGKRKSSPEISERIITRPRRKEDITSKKRIYKCVLCDLQFSKNESFKKHLEFHKTKKQNAPPGFTKLILPAATDPIASKPMQCIFCHLKLSCLKEWREHEQIHASETKPYRCNYETCKSSFKNRSALKSHYKTHTQVRPYQCNYCTKRFNQRGNALAHERMHTGAKPYLCSECGKAFRESGNLKCHMRKHTGEKPFACHLCPKHFSTLYSRKVHVRTHLQDKPYLCSECGKSFVASGKLLIHKRIHSGYRPYVCTLCSAAFHDGNGLKRHMKTH